MSVSKEEAGTATYLVRSPAGLVLMEGELDGKRVVILSALVGEHEPNPDDDDESDGHNHKFSVQPVAVMLTKDDMKNLRGPGGAKIGETIKSGKAIHIGPLVEEPKTKTDEVYRSYV